MKAGRGIIAAIAMHRTRLFGNGRRIEDDGKRIPGKPEWPEFQALLFFLVGRRHLNEIDQDEARRVLDVLSRMKG
jgi:hypothetical protein